ncbi:MAG: ankyrin repeat domain-containing protein, partial [Candidatus Poribacteria bacterium]
ELENGETPLASASREGQIEIVRFLLEQGADPNLADGDWATPLARIKKEEHTEIVEMLHRHGARK